MDVFDLKGIDINQLFVKDIMSSAPVIASKGDTLSDVIAQMKRLRVREVPVMDGDKPVGLVSYSSFLMRRSLPLSSKVEQVMRPAPRLEEDMAVANAVQEMMAAGVRGAPVVRNSRMVGFLSRTDIIKIIPDLEQLKGKKVSEFMTRNPQAVTEKENIRKAQMLMKGLMEKSLPVVDADYRLMGAVTMHDVMDILWTQKAKSGSNETMGGREAPEITVESVMSKPAVSVSPEKTAGEVAKLMYDKGLATVFVVDQTKLIGVVSQADLMEQIISLKQMEGVYVQITGLSEDDPEIYTVLYDQIEKSMKRIDKIQFPRVFTVHVSVYHHEGTRSKYSLHGRLTTDKSMYFANSIDWDLFKSMDSLLQQLEKNMKREHEKTLDMRKRK